jgi:putative endonuclease
MRTEELGDLSPTNFDQKIKQNMIRKNSSKLVGDEGEKIACEYLVEKGYKILGRNCKIYLGKGNIFGEIDIIAKKSVLRKLTAVKFLSRLFSKDYKAIHFVEVKTIFGNESNFFPEEKVDYRKRGKLRKLCMIWLNKNRFPENYPYQIDVVGILINKNTGKAKIHYFENAVEDSF